MSCNATSPAKAWAWLLVSLVLSGCGGGPSDTPSLGTVTGTVTLDDEPLPEATVTFQPLEGRASSGVTNAEGKYELKYTAELDGAKVGEHTVSISTATEGHPAGEGDDTWVEGKEETLPEKYNSKSELKETVNEGENTIDFPLASGG